MKPGIHPDYTTMTVELADGTTATMRSTLGRDIQSDVDSTNHPFYTGKRQFVDTAGRVEKFRRRYGNRGKKQLDDESTDTTDATPQEQA